MKRLICWLRGHDWYYDLMAHEFGRLCRTCRMREKGSQA